MKATEGIIAEENNNNNNHDRGHHRYINVSPPQYDNDVNPSPASIIEIQSPPYDMDDQFDVRIRKLDGGEYIIENVTDDITIRDFKRLVENKYNEPAVRQRLIYLGKELQDEQLLSECNILTDCIIHMILRNVVNIPNINNNNNNNPNNLNVGEGGNNNFPPQANNMANLGFGMQAAVNPQMLELRPNIYETVKLCRMVRSFSAINAFFFILMMFLSAGSFLMMIGVIGSMFGYIGATKLNKCYLQTYMVWLIIECVFRIAFMQSNTMILWFFTIVMVAIEFYVFQSTWSICRMYNNLTPEDRIEIITLNNMRNGPFR